MKLRLWSSRAERAKPAEQVEGGDGADMVDVSLEHRGKRSVTYWKTALICQQKFGKPTPGPCSGSVRENRKSSDLAWYCVKKVIFHSLCKCLLHLCRCSHSVWLIKPQLRLQLGGVRLKVAWGQQTNTWFHQEVTMVSFTTIIRIIKVQVLAHMRLRCICILKDKISGWNLNNHH